MSIAPPTVAPPRSDEDSHLERVGSTRRSRFTRHVVLCLVGAVMMYPLLWMVSSSLKPSRLIFTDLSLWPADWDFSNYPDGWTALEQPFTVYLVNSFVIVVLSIIGNLILCSLAAYGFARLRFTGRDILFGITLATLMIPPIVTFIPTYVLFAKLQLIGGYTPLILPAFFGNAFFIFMMRQFFLGIPRDLSDAARIDGAGEFRIFWQIMLPLVRPALMVVAVFSLLYTWHDFFGPLIYLQDQSQFPLSLGLYAFKSQRTAEWARIMMGSFLTTLPLIIVFLFTQRYFLRGIATTGLKG